MVRIAIFVLGVIYCTVETTISAYTINKQKRQAQVQCHPSTKSWTDSGYVKFNDAISRRQSIGKAAGSFVSAMLFSVLAESHLPHSVAYALQDPNDMEQERPRSYKFKSGIQFRDVRVGKGPLVTETSSTDKDDGEPSKATVLMHVQALLRDGTILMDTRNDGRPILYELGEALNTMGAPRVVTQGMDDAIVSRGTLAGTGGERVEPMRQGGIRLVVVPAELAYGNGGVSRYQAWKIGDNFLKKPVPRDEVLRYEIEILRCIDVSVQLQARNGKREEPITRNAQACCPEELYPCQGPNTEVQSGTS